MIRPFTSRSGLVRSATSIGFNARSRRSFSHTTRKADIRSIAELPDRISPKYQETTNHDLLALQWPSPPRNVLIVRKDNDALVDDALIEYANHITSAHPDLSLIFEPHVAEQVHSSFSFPVYTPNITDDPALSLHTQYHSKVDLTTTLGGDGTILHASSLFATARSVPPVLSFSMGTLGFLGEWKFPEFKRAFREVYMSGSPSSLDGAESASSLSPSPSIDTPSNGWRQQRGKSMGASRGSRILLRNRLRVGLYDADGHRLPHEAPFAHHAHHDESIFALNEVLLHRGASPHLAHITILIGSPPYQRVLTTAIADGFLISTPTGSTAYSLSSGGSIVHPLVPSLLLTPICPRSLSFRPLVLPANSPITLRIAPANRGKQIEVSVDGVRRRELLRAGMEVRVVGEEVRSPGIRGQRDWERGGVPCIVRGRRSDRADDEDHWVGGLNSLLKFNYPFGEEA